MVLDIDDERREDMFHAKNQFSSKTSNNTDILVERVQHHKLSFVDAGDI